MQSVSEVLPDPKSVGESLVIFWVLSFVLVLSKSNCFLLRNGRRVEAGDIWVALFFLCAQRSDPSACCRSLKLLNKKNSTDLVGYEL